MICADDGSIYFTDPNYRIPLQERGHGALYRVATDGTISEVAKLEYPNGLAFSKDRRSLYVSNKRWNQYITALELDERGDVRRQRIFLASSMVVRVKWC